MCSILTSEMQVAFGFSPVTTLDQLANQARLVLPRPRKRVFRTPALVISSIWLRNLRRERGRLDVDACRACGVDCLDRDGRPWSLDGFCIDCDPTGAYYA